MLRRNTAEDYICDKFLDLVEKKPFYQIKVKELVEYAEISRSSFYLYFDSIYDVVQRIEDNFMEGFIPNDDAIKIMVNGNVQMAHQQNVYLNRHAKALRLLLGTNGDPLFEYKLEKRFRTLNEAIWEERKTTYSNEMKDCLSSYLAAGNIAFIKWWTSHQGKYTENEFINMLNVLMVDASRLLLQECEAQGLTGKKKND